MKKAEYHTSEQMDVMRLRIPRDVKENFRDSCAKNGETMSAVLLQLILEYVKDN